MTDKPKRPRLLSSELDFEEITDPSNPGAAKSAPVPDWANDAEDQASSQRPQPALSKSAARYGSDERKSAKEKNSGRDNFTMYAAVIALLGFIVIFGTIVYTKQIKSDELTPSYLTLPQNVVTVDDQTIRMVVTIQVSNADGGWLASHKQALSDLFPIVMTTIDANDLSTEEGMERAREKLRTELNTRLQTDKIQAVLVDELLTRTH